MKIHAIDHDFAGWVLDSRRLWGDCGVLSVTPDRPNYYREEWKL